MAEKTLLQKLLLKPGVTLAVVGAPKNAEVPAGAKRVEKGPAEAVLLYATNAAELDARFPEAASRLDAGARLWLAYPKAGKLGTDLTRDVLWAHVQPRGFDPVRQIALDETWSAMWFRPLGQGSSRPDSPAARQAKANAAKRQTKAKAAGRPSKTAGRASKARAAAAKKRRGR